ncbi:MAG: LamG-like jellyroll fold domain-containing protein [Vicinamibacteraceae bacterium]
MTGLRNAHSSRRQVRYGAALWLLLGLLAAGSRAEAQQVINFNEVSPNDNPILANVTCAGATGFRFISSHFHMLGGAFPDFTSNGTTILGYESGRGGPITMERVGAGTFSLLALDAGEFYAPQNTDRPNANQLLITGHQSGGGTVTHTVFLDGVYDGVGGVADFEHFNLPNTFVNLTSVTFTGQQTSLVDGGVSFDNITYQLAAPEALPPCVPTQQASTNPVVTITSPAAGNVVGNVNVTATASDNTGVVNVQFKIDGVNLGAADTSAPYGVSWDTTTVADGAHTISADATDTDGNIGSNSVIVTVRNNGSPNQNPNYLDFDGTDDYARVGDADSLTFGNGATDTPFTLETWIRPDGMAAQQHLVGKWGENAAQGYEYKLYIASNVIRLDLKDASTNAQVSAFTNSQAALAGAWHHVAATYDGRGGASAANGINIYIDGVAVTVNRITGASYVAMENGTAPLQVGREGPAWKVYNGGIDELRVWNLVRTAGAIQAAMTTELTGSEGGLVGYWRLNEGSGTSALDFSPGGHIMTLFSGPTWTPGGPMSSGEPDTTAPIISNILGSNLTSSSITVSFNTNESTSARVAYTTGLTCPCTEVLGAAPGTAHSIALTGLAANTQYRFEVRATDGAGNQTISSPMMSFTTLTPPADNTPPSVSMVRPLGGATVSGAAVQVEASATDNVGVASVQFRLDGVNLGSADTTAPYLISWNSTLVADGSHTILAEARDAANNLSTTSVIVTVNNSSASAPFYLVFDGVDDYARVADANAFTFGTGAADAPMSLEVWMRPDTMASGQHLVGKWGETAAQGYEYKLYIASNVIRLDLKDASANAQVSAFTNSLATLAGAWHHVAATYDGRGGATAANGIIIYIDGVAVTLNRINSASYVAMENGTAPVQIGREGPSWKQYNGGLDDLRIWSVVRTPGAIQGSMSTELGGSEPGLVGYWKFNDGSGTNAVDGTAANRPATLFSGPVWTAGGPMASGPPDTTAPIISNILGSNLTSSGITITFSTNESTSARVAYTTNLACPCTEVLSGTTGTAHSVTLTGLTASTQYRFEVRATDGAGNQTISSPMMSFTTVAPPADSTPPSVSMVRPLGGSVSGTAVQVEASATDNVGVASVQFRLDGVNLGSADTTAPYLISWNSTLVADGSHTILAEARDAANNLSTTSVVVTVNNSTPTSPFYLDFDGVDDYARVADADALSFGNGATDAPLTIEAWIRPDAMAAGQQLAGKWGETAGQGYEYKLYIASNVIRLDLKDASANAQASAFTNSVATLAGAWHHVAVTYDGRGGAAAANGIIIYIDGVAVTLNRINSASYVAMENGTAPLQIGREGPSWRLYNGGLDELRLWNVARSASAISGFMSTALAGNEAGLVGYWRFNGGSGTTAADSSTGNRPATLFSGPTWTAGGAPIP